MTKEDCVVILSCSETWSYVICDVCDFYYATKSENFARLVYEKHINSKKHKRNMEKRGCVDEVRD